MNTKSSKKIISTTIVAVIIVLSAMVALAMADDNQNDLTESAPNPMDSSWIYGSIPCSYVCPAPGSIYTISSPCDVAITVRDGFWKGDRYEVWVDGVYIGTTPTVKCHGPVYSQGTFEVPLTPGPHKLQFKNTCKPCFTGIAPCYNGWLSCGFYYKVKIVDITPPDISVTVTPDTLWPPNHKMVDITATVTCSDICDAAAPTVVLTSITSDEPDNAIGIGDGNTIDDIQGAEIDKDDRKFQLRAERAGTGDGRVYTITYTATDASGNSATAFATVVVPHDMD